MNRLDEKISIIDSISYDGVDFEIIAYNNLEGASKCRNSYGSIFCKSSWIKNEASKNKVK